MKGKVCWGFGDIDFLVILFSLIWSIIDFTRQIIGSRYYLNPEPILRSPNGVTSN